ncbi:MAG: A/G-specific adenine glycosylase [Clostridia bacterium]|nr:A/G-specific adenine glycosylase [Clostridia bacterium]
MVEPLLQWYEDNKRSLPWRDDPTPYHVWLSEIMLQQTRIEAVLPYYARFLAACPSVANLATIDDEALMKLWQGLGYYSRARNLKRAAQQIMEKYDGIFPADYNALRALPGVGPYTAGAIASIAFGLPEPAVDGNVLRVVMRLCGDPSDIMAESVKRQITAKLRTIYPKKKEHAAALTQAIMELGQRVCIPNGEPHCESCPLGLLCVARANGLTDSIPYRAPKKPRRVQARTILLPYCADTGADGRQTLRFALRKRPPKGLLSGLWEFPGLDGTLDPAQVCRAAQALCGISEVHSLTTAPTAVHIFTHIEWHMTAYLLHCTPSSDEGGLTWASLSQLRDTYAVPSAFRAYLQYLEQRFPQGDA